MLRRNSPETVRHRLLIETDRCVKCGLCLPTCPTYQVAGTETESPRGRLALMEALVRGQVPAQGALDEHLQNCLLCRACESACPSGVKYGAAMDLAREITRDGRSGWLDALAGLLSRPGLGAIGIRAGQWLPNGLSIRQVPVGRLGRTAAELSAGPPRPGEYPAIGQRQGRVGLFLGCIGRHLQARALHAAVRVLRRLGYDVLVPAEQGCCGAMHLHLGDSAAAQRLAERNRDAFAGRTLDVVLSLATGCGIHLSEHMPAQWPHQDLNAFLADHVDRAGLDFNPLAARAAVHTPCSQRRMGMDAKTLRRLLAHIPDLELIDLPGNDRCCGAAGLHLLSHYPLAEELARPKLRFLLEQRPDWLLSGNPGCLLHLADQARAAGVELAAVHPVELLAGQLQDRA